MKTRNRKSKGFTLVELLVVISIIGMLIALLLPAVQAARETARANDCRSQMKNWALAIAQYEINRGQFPGYLNDVRPDKTVNSTGNHERSWAFVVLPYMDNRAVYDQYVTGTYADAANSTIAHALEVAICKSNPPEDLASGAMSYAVNVGQKDNDYASGATRDGRANGVFHYRGVAGGAGETLVTMTQAFISSFDGVSNTVLLSENADAWNWSGSDSGEQPTDPPTSGHKTYERYVGIAYNSTADTALTSGTADPWRINHNFGESKATGGTPLADIAYMRPSSYHPSGVNVGFTDGKVKFISEDISYSVFQAIMTTRGSQAYNNGSATLYGAGSGPTIIPSEDAIR